MVNRKKYRSSILLFIVAFTGLGGLTLAVSISLLLNGVSFAGCFVPIIVGAIFTVVGLLMIGKLNSDGTVVINGVPYHSSEAAKAKFEGTRMNMNGDSNNDLYAQGTVYDTYPQGVTYGEEFVTGTPNVTKKTVGSVNRVKNVGAGIIQMLFGGFFTFVSLIFVVLGLVFCMPKFDISNCTEKTVAQVIDFSTSSISDSDGYKKTTYAPIYSYTVDSKEYKLQAEVYSANAPKVGTISDAYYNPVNPTECIVVKSFISDMTFPLFGLVFTLIGLIVGIGGLRKIIKRRERY